MARQSRESLAAALRATTQHTVVDFVSTMDQRPRPVHDADAMVGGRCLDEVFCDRYATTVRPTQHTPH